VRIEGDIAALAAERALKEDIAEAIKILAQIKKRLDEGASQIEQFLEYDKELHLTIAQMTGNPAYMFILRAIHNNIHRFYDQFLPKREGVLLDNYRNHCKTIEAIEKKKPNDARKLAEYHVHQNYRIMTKKELLVW